jgi:hypothetical protein
MGVNGNYMRRALGFGGVMLLAGQAAWAVSDITIPDLGAPSYGSGWYSSVNEDNEIEYKGNSGQVWDFEKFILDDTAGKAKLNVIGGFNFVTGKSGWYSGDIFIAAGVKPNYGGVVSGPAGNGFTTQGNGTWGYNYAIVFNRNNAATPGGGTLGLSSANTVSYSVYALGKNDDVIAYYDRYYSSSPFRVVTDGLTPIDDGVATFGSFTGGSGQGATGLLGDSTGNNKHYYLSDIDLSFLAGKSSGDVYYHFTIGSGNDTLMGRSSSFSSLSIAQVPDGGITVAMLGLALGGLGLVQRQIRL